MTTNNPTILPAATARSIVQSIVDAARRAVDAVAGAWHRRRLLRELEAIDDRTLRDIGVQRAELGSLVAELTGAAPLTRRRVARPATGATAARG